MGYYQAGFNVIGVDIEPQPNYPFPFIQADALQVLAAYGREADAIHASPPCQAYSKARRIHGGEYPEFIEPVREGLLKAGRPYIIENVEFAPLRGKVMLCGAMFGLGVYRHRMFECSFPVEVPPHPPHNLRVAPLGYADETRRMTVAGHFPKLEYARRCMNIDWMNRDELAEAIPPDYTRHIGKYLMRAL